MSSHATFLLTSLLLHPLYVTCLKCYVGVEGAQNLTEVDVENPEAHMCSYIVRAIGACNFSDKYPPVYTVYIKDDTYSKRCWYGDDLVVCSCMTELCNGDIVLMQKLWDKTKITDENVKECVARYLKSRQGLIVHRKDEMELKAEKVRYDTDMVPVMNEEEPARQRISGIQSGPKNPNAKRESDSDFIIFLILVIVAVVLLIAIIPAWITCLALNKKRKEKRAEYVSLKTGKSTARTGGGRTEKSNKSTKSTTSANSLKSGKSQSKRKGGKSAKSTRSKAETKKSLKSGRSKGRSSRKGRK